MPEGPVGYSFLTGSAGLADDKGISLEGFLRKISGPAGTKGALVSVGDRQPEGVQLGLGVNFLAKSY